MLKIAVNDSNTVFGNPLWIKQLLPGPGRAVPYETQRTTRG
jgi:hypothetical protein